MEIIDNSRKLVKIIYKFEYPKNEVYGLQSQIRRASVSILLNIVEGNQRNSRKEYLNFCYIAKGSLFEVEECYNLSKELFNLENPEINKLIIFIRKQLINLIKYLTSQVSNLESNRK